jgi:hypothetical protein
MTTKAKTVRVVVRTDAVFANGAHHHYGQEVELDEKQAAELLREGRVEKAE